MRKRIKCIFCLFLSFSFLIAAERMQVCRAVFDIGSGSTKMAVANVNAKTGKITILWEVSEKVAYKQDLEMRKSQNFSKKIEDRGIAVLARLKYLAKQRGATSFAGVATSAFRTARNAKKFCALIRKSLGIRIAIISQSQEALLGFKAAIYGETYPKKAIVWDIGGGSLQMTTLIPKKPGKCERQLVPIQKIVKKHAVFGGKIGAVSFARYIIEKIQGKDIRKKNTPNPISSSEAVKAKNYAKSIARKVPKIIRSRIACKNSEVIGIGGVHYYSIRNQIKAENQYTIEELRRTLKKRLNMTDQQIGGPYAKTEISNLILVLAFMEELKIKKIRLKRINMASALLLTEKFWK